MLKWIFKVKGKTKTLGTLSLIPCKDCTLDPIGKTAFSEAVPFEKSSVPSSFFQVNRGRTEAFLRPKGLETSCFPRMGKAHSVDESKTLGTPSLTPHMENCVFREKILYPPFKNEVFEIKGQGMYPLRSLRQSLKVLRFYVIKNKEVKK